MEKLNSKDNCKKLWVKLMALLSVADTHSHEARI